MSFVDIRSARSDVLGSRPALANSLTRLASRMREARATPLCFLTLAMVAMNDDGRRARGELM